MEKRKLLTLMSSVCLGLILVALAFIAACAQPAPAPAPAPPAPTPTPAPAPPAKPIVLKTINFLPLQLGGAEGMKRFINMVNERSKGQLVLNFAGASEVVPTYDQPEAIRTGVADVTSIFVGAYAKLQPEVQSLTFSEIMPWEERDRGYFNLMVELHKKINLRYLGRCDANQGFYMMSKKKLGTPADFVGMKFCTGPIFLPVFKALGAVGVVMPAAEKYSGLERGVVDGINTVPADAVGFSFYEVANYWLDHELFEACDVAIIMNLDKWNSLPKPLQDLLTDVVVSLEHDIADYRLKAVADYKQQLKKKLEFTYFSPADAKWFRDTAYRSCWADIEKKVSPEMYGQLRNLLGK